MWKLDVNVFKEWNWKTRFLINGNFIGNVIVILTLLFELNIYELELNDNWIRDLIKNEVNWDVNILTID